MHDVQELMRRIIRHGFYGTGRSSASSAFMCNAAKEAYRRGCIALSECWAVVEAAEQYIYELSQVGASVCTMGEACYATWPDGPHMGQYHTSCDADEWAVRVGRVLYWNWDKRPRKTNNE